VGNTGEHDTRVMHSSASIHLNCVEDGRLAGVKETSRPGGKDGPRRRARPLKRAILARIARAWVVGLVAVSLQPWRPGGHHGGVVHAVLHFLAFFSTALLLAFAARGVWQRIYAPMAVVALGAAIEYAQHLLYRGAFEWGDLVSDACAALLACLLARSRSLHETLVR